VVNLLETVHTILRVPAPAGPPCWRESARLYVLVLAHGRWIRQAFASTYANFERLGSPTHDLGSDFAQKLFDHTLLVPDLTVEQTTDYLAALIGPTGAPLKSSNGNPDISPEGTTARDAIESVDPADLRSPQLDRALADPALTPSDREALEIVRVRREATTAVTAARSEHLLQAYATLMPANPRLVKRVANAFGMLLAIKSHTRHTEEDDAIARSAILLVRFPVLAEQLRTDHSAATHRDTTSGTDDQWRRLDVRQVVGTHSLDTLARCLGRSTTATETNPVGTAHRPPDSNGSQE
jgi:hypothetical protein